MSSADWRRTTNIVVKNIVHRIIRFSGTTFDWNIPTRQQFSASFFCFNL